MVATEQRKLRFMFLAPATSEASGLRKTVQTVAKETGIEIIGFESFEESLLLQAPSAVYAELATVDLVIVGLSYAKPNIWYEIGLAHASGKPVVCLIDKAAGATSTGARLGLSLTYESTPEGLIRLRSRLRQLFEDFRNNPQRVRSFSPRLSGPSPELPYVDLERLEPREFENLCFELLTQMGFRRAEWGVKLKEVDLVATLPKRDPDGFEYQELWLISMGLHTPPDILVDMALEPGYLAHRLRQAEVMQQSRGAASEDSPITLLLIFFDPRQEQLNRRLSHMELRLSDRKSRSNTRVRVWDRQHLVMLIQRYPQIAYKYFSEEGRVQSKRRKPLEDVYRELVDVNERQRETVAALKEERDKRVRAERDAVWKDVAFKAAHKLGNPVFALETDLQGITRRIRDNPEEAENIAKEMGVSIEKAKSIIDQFKSLTRAQEVTPRPIDIIPVIKSASRIATENGVSVTVTPAESGPKVMGDPTRMSECFDELFANALHWLDKDEKRISVTVQNVAKKTMPAQLDESKKYVVVRMEDNGCGIPLDKKEAIFSPFFTTYLHGTGLGLSVVQRIVEGHGGIVRESGTPGEGARFELFLPRADPNLKDV